MKKCHILKASIFFLVKYFVFYLLLMIKNENTYFLKIGNIKNGVDLFYYLWLLLSLPLISFLILFVPICFTLKVNRRGVFLFLILLILVAEYLVYTYLASSSNLMNGVINGVVSIIFLLVFFYKDISKKFK